ncbi:Isoleucyl-tRNA synthetase [hydrothermal vent metagenome]|uniref:isoleucine--tRNA ligase n=1 Tax=hydrothermal vent metagenome TaxID=652676 RepID=A0A3B1BCN7_9ZZZZ
MDYKDTLNLPSTSFPMKANLALKELEIQGRWDEMGLYELIRESRKDAEKFTLHDGPPYANGHIHSGHALNKILKDIIVKVKTMEGFDAPYVPGWDCHGLPIEREVDKKLGKAKLGMTKAEIRQNCREYAGKFVEIQKDEFIRLGVLGDWENPYLTMNHDYEIGTIREFAKFVKNGGVYRGFKPVHWCSSCRTALAEAEVEHADHKSPSIFTKFKLSGKDAKSLGLPENDTYLVIWTTTPWTLPANLAVCLHPDFDYSAVKSGDEVLILATDLKEQCMKTFEREDFEVIASFSGTKFENMTARHPFLEQDSLVIVGDHVTLEQGTGLVHTAPGHGQEDYVIGQKYGLEVFNPVDSAGRFMADTPHFAGKKVQDANPDVIELLREKGALLFTEKISHSYPHCWRCRNPIIFRATAQWFISMEKNDLRIKSLEAIRNIKWTPAWGEERIFGMIENRPDWCVSRQRTWGVPITSFHCKKCEETLFNGEVADHVANVLEKEGLDVWFTKPAENFLPDGAKCEKCGGAEFDKGRDILDVWFDSGVSHALVVDKRPNLSWPSDLYIEGSDQHRGWFHTSLLEAIGTCSKAPYKGALTHGYVVDGKGKKMSKSQGNVIAPETIIKRYGAEIVRLWVASEDYREDIRLSDEILRRLTEAYRKIRNTIRFMLGNLSDFNPDTDLVPFEDRTEIDRVIILKFRKLTKKVIEALDRYDFHVFYHAMHNFCVVDLSAFYLDIIKDRIYTYPKTGELRRSAQSTLYELTNGMLRLMAPVLSFTAEEAWGNLPGDAAKREKSVHLATFPESDIGASDEKLLSDWDRIVEIRDEVNRALELARQKKIVGHSLDAEVELTLFQADRKILEKHIDGLQYLFIVSKMTIADEQTAEDVFKSETVPGLTALVTRSTGEKCERCWNYSHTVGTNTDHPQVCERCAGNLAAFK